MIKQYCDVCGKDITDFRNKFHISYRVHLEMICDGLLNYYVDSEGNAVSGRSESYDTCASCYNKIMMPAVRKFKELKKENNQSIGGSCDFGLNSVPGDE